MIGSVGGVKRRKDRVSVVFVLLGRIDRYIYDRALRNIHAQLNQFTLSTLSTSDIRDTIMYSYKLPPYIYIYIYIGIQERK